MHYTEIPPPSSLTDIVRYFWIIESDENPPISLQYRLFAESSPGLVFFYHHNCALISGLTDSHREFTIHGKLGMMGAYLYPYAFPLLFNTSAEEITNTTTEISEVLGCDGLLLRDEIMNALSNRERVGILSQFLLGKLKNNYCNDKGLCAGIRQIVSTKGGLSIDALIKDTGISGRHFDRKFMKSVGVAPKFFSRLTRFHSTLKLPQQIPIKNLTELALHAGYFDQSHFIRDFKTFSGLSPKDYFKLDRHHVADNFVQIRG